MQRYDYNVPTRQYRMSMNFSRKEWMKTLQLVNCITDRQVFGTSSKGPQV